MKRTSGTANTKTRHEVTTMMRIEKSFIFPALFLALSTAAVAGCNDSPFTVAVDRPLRVVYMNPGPSQQNVPLDAQVSVVFSEEVLEAGFKDEKNFSVAESSANGWKAVSGSTTWDAKSRTLVFKSAEKLKYSATYRIHLGTGLTKADTADTRGGRLPGDIDAVFATVDPPELMVLSVYPSNGAAGVAPDARIVVAFSQKIDQEKPSFDPTASFVVTDTADPAAPSSVPGVWVFDDAAGHTVATFTPADPKDASKAGQLGYSRVVRLTLSRDVRSLDAKGIMDSAAEKDRKVGHLPAAVTVNFSTEALPVLSAISMLPAPGSHGVPTDAAVTVMFSEPVDQPSVVTAAPAETFVVKDLAADAVIPGAVVWSADGAFATFTPALPFGYSRQAGIELTSGIRSVRALALVNPPPDRKAIDGYLVPAVAASFSTIDPPDLLFVDLTPDPGSDNIARDHPVRIVFSEPVDTVPFAQYPTDLTVTDYAIRVVDITDQASPSLIAPKDPATPVAFSEGDSEVTFTPAIPWGWSRTFQVELSMTVRSKRATQVSGSLPQAISFTFKTLDPPPFALVAAAPSAGADSVGIDSRLSWAFSTALDPATLMRKIAEGAVSSAGADSITVSGAEWPENSLAGEYLKLSKTGEADVHAFIKANTVNIVTAEAPFGVQIDDTWSYRIDEPSIRVSFRDRDIAPAALSIPFMLYGALLDSGAAASATADTLVDGAKSWDTDAWKGHWVYIVKGIGAGQARKIAGNTADTITVDPAWDTAPDTTSWYDIADPGIVDSGTATGGGTDTLVDAAKAWTEGGLSSTTLMLIGGTGEGQVRSVLHNDGTTLYLDEPWDATPDATSVYELRRFTTVRFAPAKHLAYGAEYRVDLTGGTDIAGDPTGVTSAIATREGGYLPGPISYSFATVEPPPLLVAWTSPSDRADSIAPDVQVVVTFSEDVDPATLAGNITFTGAGGAAVPFTLAPQGIPTNQMTLTPAQADPAWPRLAYSTGHTVTLSDAIASVRGGRLPEDFTSTFKTIDPPPLALVSATPSSAPQAENEGVPRETSPDSGAPTSFALAFSEGVKRSTVDTNGDGKLDAADHGNLKVEDVTALSDDDARDPSKAGVPIKGSFSWNDTDAPKSGSRGRGDDTTLTFTPEAILDYSALIRITARGQDSPACADTSSCTLTDAVTSDRATAEDGQLPDTVVVLFRIEDPPPLSLISVVNAGGLATQPRDAGGGAPDSTLVTFSEGVRQALVTLRSATNPAGAVVLEDVTGKANPLTDAANGYIDATLAFLDYQGDPAADAAPGSSGVGADAVVRITPNGLLDYGTVIRLTLAARDAPDLTAIQSDRATFRSGQLPACRPSTGHTCVDGNYVAIIKVEELPPLSVLSFVPGNLTGTAGAGAREVAFDRSTVTAVFSEALDCASVTAATAPVIWDSTDPVNPGTAIDGVWSCADDTATFTATSPLGYSRDVVTALGTAIRSARSALSNPSLDPAIGRITAPYYDRFTTEDPEAPVVVSMTPGPVSTGVPRMTTIAVTFDRPMDTASFTASTFRVCDTTNDVVCAVNLCPPARLAFSAGNTTVTCTPTAALAYSAAIRVSLYGGPAGLKSAAATSRDGWFSPVPDPITYTFFVEDLPPLQVLATNFSGSGTYSIDQQIELIFGGWLNWTDVQGPPPRIFLVKTADPATLIGATLNEPIACTAGNACKVTLTPATPLDYASQYMAVVLGGYPGGVCMPERNANDADGCIPALSVPGTGYLGLYFNFTTESTPGLEVSATAPVDGDTGVQLLPTLSVTFNNELNPATVSTQSICLTEGNNLSTDCGGALAIPIDDWTISPDNRTVTATPAANLSYDTWYTIVVTKSVFDDYGQSLTAFYTAAFQTMTSALIQDIVVFNSNDLVPPNNLYVRVRFNEDMDLSTITTSTMYVTYVDGFGVTVPVPSTVNTTQKTAVLTPDLAALYACDDMKAVISGNDGSTDAARPQSLRSAGTNFDNSYIGKVAYMKSSLGASGYYTITGVDIVDPGADQRLLLAEASFATETGVEWSVVEPFPALPYSTTYTLHLVTTISNAAHDKHVDALAGQSEFLSAFVTGSGPQLASVVYENHVVKPSTLYSATEVPINAKFTASFNEAIDPATVTDGTVIVEEQRGSDGVIATPATFTSASAGFNASDVGKRVFVTGSIAENNGIYAVQSVVDAATVTVNPNFAAADSPVSWGLAIDGSAAGVIGASTDNKAVIFDTTKLPALLKYETTYRLLLVGSYSGGPATTMRLANGNPVLGLHAARFVTSPSMTVTSNPVGGTQLNQQMVFTAMFSRSLYTGSLTDNTIYATQAGIGKLTAMIATNTEFPNYATLMPVPTFRQSGTGAVVTITTGVQDYRGNPMPSPATISFSSVSNPPSTTAIILDAPASVAPNAGAIAADREWTLTWVIKGDNRNILMPSSFGAASIVLVEDPSGTNTVVSTVSRVEPGANVTVDKVKFRPSRPLKAGTAYRLTLVPANMSNMYLLSSDAANMIYNYTCETAVPLLGANQVTPNTASQPPTTEVTAWFNEQIDIKTVSTSTFTVRVNGTAAAIPGAYRQEYDAVAGQWKVTFTPSSPLKNLLPNIPTSYDVVLTNGIKDLAGNAFAGQTFLSRFSVTGAAPLLASHSPAAAAVNASIGTQVAYNFSSPIDPITAYAPTSTTAGSLNIAFTDGCGIPRTVYGCVRLQDGGRQVVYRPATALRLPSSQVITADFDATKVADLAGNLADRNGLAPWNFNVIASNPIATCHQANVGAGTVIVSFTDDIDAATVSAATFAVFDVTTGVPVNGTLATAGKDVAFTRTGGAFPAGDYGVLAMTGIASTDGHALLADYHAYFTVP